MRNQGCGPTPTNRSKTTTPTSPLFIFHGASQKAPDSRAAAASLSHAGTGLATPGARGHPFAGGVCLLGTASRAASWSADEAMRLGLGFILLMYRLMIRFCEDDSDSMYGCNLHTTRACTHTNRTTATPTHANRPTCMSASRMPVPYCDLSKRWNVTVCDGFEEVVNRTAAHALTVI